MKYFSTFSGIGGFEIGIHDAFSTQRQIQRGLGTGSADNQLKQIPLQPLCVGYSEIDKYAIKTYEEHFDHENFGDITAIDADSLPDFDLFVGGFPCQAFSVAGKRRGFEEARGTLFFDVARIIKHKRPGHFVLENVKGLLSHDSGKTFEVILGILTDLGYDVEWHVLNSKNFGVPQNRERVYIVGHLGNRCGRKIFPLASNDGQAAQSGQHEPRGQEKFIKTRHLSQNGGLVSDSITLQASEIPHVVAGVKASLRNGLRMAELSPTLDTMYRKGMPGLGQDRAGAMVSTRAVARRGREGGSEYEFRNDDLANTVRTATGGGSMGMVSSEARIRRLTPRECERLQGFPDDWTVGSDTQRYKQCGNAVTTNVVAAVMESLRDCLV